MTLDKTLAVRAKQEKTLGRVIQEYRQKKGWTQEELAWRTGITREHLGRIERDKCIPSIATLECLEKALGLSPMTLLLRKTEDNPEISLIEEMNIGKSCRELEKVLTAKLTEAELEKVSEAIDTFTELLKKC